MLRAILADGSDPGDSSVSDDPITRTIPKEALGRFEHYELLRGEDGNPVELGRGAMGVTYKGFDVNLQCPVAVKVISTEYLGDESARSRFLREARAAASIRDSNVASVLHLGRIGEDYFYAMEFVEGETLKNLLQNSGSLEVSLALEITAQVASGLAALHRQNLIHRDIKPGNIIVSPKVSGTRTAKIIDLGLAKSVDEISSGGAISLPGTFAGTPEYASPEQFAGLGVDIRSDLYSLGVTLWEMLTNRLPFPGSTAEMMYKHQHASLPLSELKRVPQPVTILLQILLEKDPAKRLQSPDELITAISAVIGSISSGRSMTEHGLRKSAVSPRTFIQQAENFQERLRAIISARQFRLIRWITAALLVVSGLLLAIFFVANHKTSNGPSDAFAPIRPPAKSIAILPFESLTDNRNDTYFADGVQNEILSDLAKMSELKVISRTSVMGYRPGGQRDLRSIAGALGVAHVVEGTVRRDANRVRVTVELVDAQSDATLWADSYDRDLTNIFDIQNDIAKAVASKLSTRLSAQEEQKIEDKPTDNLEAYDLYLQAKEQITNAEFFIGAERESYLNSIKLLEEATLKDPRFALAYCLTAQADDDLYFSLLDHTPERRARGDAAVKEALRLRPDLPEVHLAMAYHLYECYRDYARANVHIAIAERSLPNSPDTLALKAYIDRRQGRWEDSMKALQKAWILDPRNSSILNNLEFNYVCLRRYQEAEEACNHLLELEPDNATLNVRKAYYAFGEKADLSMYRAALEGLPSSLKYNIAFTSQRILYAAFDRDWTAAREILNSTSNKDFSFFRETIIPRGCVEIWLAKVSGDHPWTEPRFYAIRDQLNRTVQEDPNNPGLLSVLGLVDGALGRTEDALQEARRAVRMLPIQEDGLDGPSLAFNLAIVYAWTGNPDLAFGELNILIKTPGGVDYGELKRNPSLDSLRDDPRFKALLAQLAPQG
ncbi:MAG: protein kinase [Verrucomicrobia bacterium]|nr:protein kinase [Verrucomicrobiota bacterium]